MHAVEPYRPYGCKSDWKRFLKVGEELARGQLLLSADHKSKAVREIRSSSKNLVSSSSKTNARSPHQLTRLFFFLFPALFPQNVRLQLVQDDGNFVVSGRRGRKMKERRGENVSEQQEEGIASKRDRHLFFSTSTFSQNLFA